MKRNIAFLVVLLLMVGIGYSAVFEIENESERTLVTMVNQEPDPVEPGNAFDVRFRIENYMSRSLQNVEVMIVPKFPLSLYGTEEEIKKIGTLAPRQKDETGVLIKFRLFVDSNAAEGENALEFRYRESSGAWIKGGDFSVDVRTKEAVLAINEITTEPKTISPGSQIKVRFKIENMADSALKDIKLNLELYRSAVLATGITTSELPFSPVGSSNEKTLNKIDPKKGKMVSFNLFVDADAESKMYKIPFTLTYSDTVGMNFSRRGIIGLKVDAKPDMTVSLDDTDIYSTGAKGSIDIRFVNKGFSDIKFLDVILEDSGQYEILSNHEVYIGNLDSDDYETAEYDLLIGKDVKEDVNLPLKVEYRDANGKLYSKDINLKLELFSGEELKRRAGNGGNSFIGIVIVIVVLVAGILFWRWRKKKKAQR